MTLTQSLEAVTLLELYFHSQPFCISLFWLLLNGLLVVFYSKRDWKMEREREVDPFPLTYFSLGELMGSNPLSVPYIYSPFLDAYLPVLPPPPPQVIPAQPQPMPSVVESPDDDGKLRLEGNLEPWIANNPSSSYCLVKHLVLSFLKRKEEECEIGDSIRHLSLLSHLTIEYAKSLKYLLHSMACLPSLQFLNFEFCEFEELPANLGVFNNLTHLYVSFCYNIKSIPESIATLSNLSSLHLFHCGSLTELPPNLGHLRSLQHLSLHFCHSLVSLPANPLNLESLYISSCDSLTELPANLKVKHLQLMHSSIKFIPSGLFNLRHFETTLDTHSHLSLANLEDFHNLHHLTIQFQYVQTLDIQKLKANLSHLVHLQILSFRATPFYMDKLPANLELLHELILLDIQDTTIKYLPWSITKLPKLRFVMLPGPFRLQTMPFHLNDSIRISVEGRHVRKPWKQLKQEIGVSVSDFPIAQEQYPFLIAPPGYLSFRGILRKKYINNYESLKLVKMLELQLPDQFNVERTKKSIGELPNLTHLFVTNANDKDFLPLTITGLKHLFLHLRYSCESYSPSLSELTNLETLELVHRTFPTMTNLPASLRRLSLKSCSFPDNIAKLTNLHTLELYGHYNLTSLPPTLKIDQIIKSLPISLRHLEILHVKGDCFDKFCDMYCDSDILEHCLTQLVNLEILSLTCYRIKSLPSMAGQHNLRVLLLKDCFALKELLPDLEKFVELHTLDISGTRIKSLPDSIINLSKLQQLTVPQCFTQKLPSNLKEVSIVDDTDRRYYERMGYYDSDYETITHLSYEGNDVIGGSIGGVNDASTEDPIHGVLDGQACEQDEAIPQVPSGSGRKDVSDGYNHHAGCSSCNQDVEIHCNNDNSQQAPQNDEMCLMNRKNEQQNAACDTSNVACGEETDNNPSVLENEEYMLPQSDKVQKTQKIDISKEKIQALFPRNMRLVDAAEELGVSRSTLKRRLTDLKIKWPSSKKGKQNLNAKKRKPNSETDFSSNSLQQMGNSTRTTNNDNTVDNSTRRDPSFAKVKETVVAPQCNKADHQLVEQQLQNGSNECTLPNIVQQDGTSNTFTVKATYYDDTVKFSFSLKYSIEQLEQEVGKRLKLVVGTFRMKYQDEDGDWIRMSCTSELEEPLCLSRSSGVNYVKLSITDERFLNGGQHSQENLGQLIPTKSEVRSACLPISFEKEQLKHIQCAGENSSQPTSWYSFSFHESWVARIEPLIEGHTYVKADGNCGFRVIATFEYGDEEKWLDVRLDLLKELNTNEDLYRKALGGYEEFLRANSIVNWLKSPAEKEQWFEATCLGLVVATKYQKVFTCWSNECYTFLPLVSRLFDHKPPTMYINMARINGDHFMALRMPTNIPLPPLSPLWKSHCDETVKHWGTSIFKKQLDDYELREGIPEFRPLDVVDLSV